MADKPIVTTVKGTRLFLAARRFVRANPYSREEYESALGELRFAVHVIETDEEV